MNAPRERFRRPAGRWIALASIAAVAMTGVPVHARAPAQATRPRVVVLGPTMEGDVSSAAAETIVEALQDGLRRGDVEVIASLVPAATCADAACRHEKAVRSQADALVVLEVVAARRDYDVAIALVDGKTGEEFARVERRCELCGVAELAEHVDGQAAALLARLQSQHAAPAMIAIRTTPAGALVRVDEHVVGETPIERRVELGPHVVSLSLRGYVDEMRRFDALAGVRETIALELVPLPDTDRRRRMRAGGFAALAIGTASLAAGITLIALHGRQNHTRCSGANIDADGDCKYLYATRTPGIVVTSIGAAALFTAIGLLVASRRRDRKR